MSAQNRISGIKNFVLKLSNQSFSAKHSEIPFIGLMDQGIRNIIRINQNLDSQTKDDNGNDIAVFGKWLKQGFRIVISTEIRIRLKKIGKTANPDIRIKTPALSKVYNSEGIEIDDPYILGLIRCELETGQSMTIEFNSELRRQTGRTSRFIETLKPGDIVIANSSSHVKQLESLISRIVGNIDVEIKIMWLDEVKKNIKEGNGRNFRFPHEFFECHKINVDDIYN